MSLFAITALDTGWLGPFFSNLIPLKSLLTYKSSRHLLVFLVIYLLKNWSHLTGGVSQSDFAHEMLTVPLLVPLVSEFPANCPLAPGRDQAQVGPFLQDPEAVFFCQGHRVSVFLCPLVTATLSATLLPDIFRLPSAALWMAPPSAPLCPKASLLGAPRFLLPWAWLTQEQPHRGPTCVSPTPRPAVGSGPASLMSVTSLHLSLPPSAPGRWNSASFPKEAMLLLTSGPLLMLFPQPETLFPLPPFSTGDPQVLANLSLPYHPHQPEGTGRLHVPLLLRD